MTEPRSALARRRVAFEGRDYDLAPGETLLDAMLRGGADVPHSCRKGTCRCCMLEAAAGDPGEEARRGLTAAMVGQGAFLPCLCAAPEGLEARRPDLSRYLTRAILAERIAQAEDAFLLRLETETVIDWRAGQSIAIRGPGGDLRSFSVLSRPEEYFVEILVRRRPGGAVSPWLCGGLEIGGDLEFTGPHGAVFYGDGAPRRPLLLMATGTGAGAAFGIARDALGRGHEGPVRLVLGARTAAGRLMVEEVAALAAAHPTLTVLRPCSQEGGRRRATDVGFEGLDMAEAEVFLCGAPEMVEAARIEALRRGAALERVHADPFDPPAPYAPRDAEKIAGVAPDPDLWAALDEGRMLSEILDAFYTEALQDPRLAPFFHKVTKQRLVEKQYAFLRDLMTGRSDYFGERPFNVHHWMIISDEIFDYREALFFGVVRARGLPAPMIARWQALHELFRREIVKAAPRGQWIDGQEIHRGGHQEEIAPMDMVCDGCAEEILTGEKIRTHQRTGELWCARCAGLAAGEEAA